MVEDARPEIHPLRLSDRRSRRANPTLLETIGEQFTEGFPEAATEGPAKRKSGTSTKTPPATKTRKRLRKPGEKPGEVKRLDHAMGVRMTMEERDALTVMAERKGYPSTQKLVRSIIIQALDDAGLTP